MFAANLYQSRREKLRHDVGSGLIVLLGNELSPMNFRANAYPFRQDASFLYFCGLCEPGLTLLLDADSGEEVLFGREPTDDDLVFTGPLPGLQERADRAGIPASEAPDRLAARLEAAGKSGRTLHVLPPYRAEHDLKWQTLTGSAPGQAPVSLTLIHAIIAQRAHKSRQEIDEIEAALELSREVHLFAMQASRPGRREFEIVAELEALIAARDSHTTFPLIFTVRGEILHQMGRSQTLRDGDWIVHDSGVTSPGHYASDISRTFPVSGRFDPRQRDLYTIALDSQEQAIARCRPGERFIDVHRHAARVILDGLRELGIIVGSVDDALEADAHTLFFPCGTGHHLGLDVHDMENLGEEHIGYDAEVRRRRDFGWRSLRMGRALQAGFVMTVEPGIYFNPHLIDQWQAAGRCSESIDYSRLADFRDAGGVRIEDDVWITPDGPEILGPPIPKSIADVEAACLSPLA